MIDRQSPVPVYYQIEQYLKKLIDQKQLKAGEQIPTERELTERFQVSRMTVRQALSNLVNAGVLIRIKGKGTFISGDQKIEKQLNSVNGFSEDMRLRGLNPTSKLLEFKQILADERTSGFLGVDVGDPIFIIKRIRRANHESLAIDTSFVPSAIVPNLTAADMEHSLYDYFEQKLGLAIDHAEQSFEAVLVSKKEAELLEIPENLPILLIGRLTFSRSGERLEYTQSLYRADRYKFTLSIPRR